MSALLLCRFLEFKQKLFELGIHGNHPEGGGWLPKAEIAARLHQFLTE